MTVEMSGISEVHHVSHDKRFSSHEDEFKRQDFWSVDNSFRRRSIRSSEETWREGEGDQNFIVVDKSNNLTWTKRDQVRLQNVDELFTRMLEHHNNVHTRTMTVNTNDNFIKSSRKFDPRLLERMSLVGRPLAEDETVLTVMSFKVSNFETKKMGKPAHMTIEEAQLYLAEMNFDDPIWQHEERRAAEAWRSRVKSQSNADIRSQLSLKMDENNFLFGRSTDKIPSRRRSSAFTKRSQRLLASTKISDMPLKDCLWIHMSDLSILDAIAGRFNLHDLVVTGFRDIRNSANFLPLPSAVFFCFCTFHMDSVTNEVSMHKVYLYMSISTNLLITYERQIMRKQKNKTGNRKEVEGHSSRTHDLPSVFDGDSGNFDHRSTTTTMNTDQDSRKSLLGMAFEYFSPKSAAESSPLPESFEKGSVVCASVMHRFTQIYHDCLRVGTLHLITTFALESLACQDTIMEFFSRSLLYTKRISDTRVKLFYREKSFVAKQLVVLTKAFKVCATILGECKYTLSALQTFLRTGNFKVRELYISEDDERAGVDDVDTYRDVLRSRLKVSSAGIGCTAQGGFQSSVKNVDSHAVDGGLVQGSTESLFSIDISDAADTHALLYKEFTNCRAFDDQQLDTMHIFMDEYNFSTSLLKEQQYQLREIKEAIDEREQLRGINMENLVALIGVSTLPMSFITSFLGMNFELSELYYARDGATIMLWMCFFFTLACVLYFHQYSYIDFSINTWRKLFVTITCYRHWGPYILPPNKEQNYNRVVRRADGNLMITVNDTRGDTSIASEASAKPTRRISQAQLLQLQRNSSSTTDTPANASPSSSMSGSSAGLSALDSPSVGTRKSLSVPLKENAEILSRVPMSTNADHFEPSATVRASGTGNGDGDGNGTGTGTGNRTTSRSSSVSYSMALSFNAGSAISEADIEDIRRSIEAQNSRRKRLNNLDGTYVVPRRVMQS